MQYSGTNSNFSSLYLCNLLKSMFYTMPSILILQFEIMVLGCKHIEIRKSECVTKTQFLFGMILLQLEILCLNIKMLSNVFYLQVYVRDLFYCWGYIIITQPFRGGSRAPFIPVFRGSRAPEFTLFRVLYYRGGKVVCVRIVRR